MDREQALVPTDTQALDLDLEAQRNVDSQAPDISHIKDPAYTNSGDSDPLKPSVDVQAEANVFKNSLFSGGRGKPHLLRSGGVTAESLSEAVKELKERYDPYWVDAPDGAGDVLSFLHHRNISHLRANLLKQYSFLCVNAKVYVDAWEDPLNRLHKDLELYMQAEKSYQEWSRLSTAQKSRQNDRIYPPDLPHAVLRTLGIIECASTYNLPDERDALARLKAETSVHLKVAPRKMGGKGAWLVSGDKRRKMEEDTGRKKFISRAATAVFGGLAVIVPMLIMSLHPTRLTQLLTTSLFVVSVALILAWLMDEAERKDMIAATAAYAAVLVVFVGAATTTDATAVIAPTTS